MNIRLTSSLIVMIAAGATALTAVSANPFLPLWEHIPDGEPYLFDDPDAPGKKRVYVYGSHDMLHNQYCGTDLVVWSASPDSLDKWRYDGVIFENRRDAIGRQLHADGRGDVLYAPDVAVREFPDGSKAYYLYPNNQEGGRNGMVARSNRPDGPFEVINWNEEKPWETIGVLRFDPAVFIDDDGRVYGYWGFEKSYAAELDPETMATVKPGTEIVEDIVAPDGKGRFFEASSIRKIGDKYVFIYSRWTEEGEWGLPKSNYTLAYAYSDSPLGPYTLGSTIIDGRGRDTDAKGNAIFTATPTGNTHGSIIEINGQWWVIYHRQSGTDEYSRQAMAAPISVSVEPGPGGKVTISEGEYTSEGFETAGLDPLKKHPAAIASHFTGKTPAYQTYPHVHYSGPYFKPTHVADHSVADPYDLKINMNPVVNITDGSTLGYKYFNFSRLNGKKAIRLALDIIPESASGEIKVYTSAPWKGHAKPVGSIKLKHLTAGEETRIEIALNNSVAAMTGKHPLYLVFNTRGNGSLCRLHYLEFLAD